MADRHKAVQDLLNSSTFTDLDLLQISRARSC